jgi:hypothetical protein
MPVHGQASKVYTTVQLQNDQLLARKQKYLLRNHQGVTAEVRVSDLPDQPING